MNGDHENPAAMALVNTIKQRIESRYRRILFVHKELEKINAAVSGAASSGANGGLSSKGSFEDFVFSQIDFSIYNKIEAEEFTLFFDTGLDDYSESFYQKAFNKDREEVSRIIKSAYIRVGPFFVAKKTSPLLLSIMRTLHTSLEFAPLLGDSDADEEQITLAAELLNGVQIRHSDNSETRLFVPETSPDAPDMTSVPGDSRPLLCGTFYPLGKAYTIALIPSLE